MIKFRIKQAKVGITLGVFAIIMAWIIFAIFSPKVKIIYLSIVITFIGFFVVLVNCLIIKKMKKAIMKESEYVTTLAKKYLSQKETTEKSKFKS